MRTKYLTAIFLLAIYSLGQSQGAGPAPPSNASVQQPVVSIGLASPEYQEDFPPVVADGHHAVSWNKGYLLSFGNGSRPIALYDKTGKWLFETPLTFEGAARIFVQDASPSMSGRAIVAVSAVNNEGAAADLIAEVGNDGIRRFIRTSPFYPFRVCATDDRTVWAYGKELTQDRNADPHGHYPMLREYSFEKGQLRSEVDRITARAPKGVAVDGGIPYDVQMRCDSKRVVILSIPTSELMEYDLGSSRVDRWPLALLPDGFHLTGAALTDSGKIYVSALHGAAKPQAQTAIFQVSVNSSGTAVWVPVTIGPAEGKWYVLLGSDGENLVYARGLQSPTLFWSKTNSVAAMGIAPTNF